MANDFDARQFVQDIEHALNTKDATRVLAHYAQDAALRDPATPETVHGVNAVRQNYELWAGAFGDARFAVKELVQTGNKVVLLLDVFARHTGDLVLGPGETVPASNRTIRLELAEFLTIDNGQIVNDLTIFDMASMLQQLGVMPSPHALPRAGKALGTQR